MADDKRQMTDGEVEVTDAVVRIRVWDKIPILSLTNSTNDKIGILSHEVMEPADRECQVLTDDGPLPKKPVPEGG